jgi:hypothetical protein
VRLSHTVVHRFADPGNPRATRKRRFHEGRAFGIFTAMRRTILILLAIAVGVAAAGATGKKPAIPSSAPIHPGLFELGLFLGEPTGLSAKYWINRKNAIEGIAAWAFSQGFLAVCGDYLFTFPDVIKVEDSTIPVFLGVGGIARIEMGAPGGLAVGARFPVGVLYVFREVPLEISLEVVPGLYLFPDTQFLAMGGFGIRYCF